MVLLDELNYLAVGKNGTYSNEGTYQSTPLQIRKIVDHLKESKTETLDVYFHGGLVSEDSGQESAFRVIDALKSDAPTPNKTHQLAFIWKTDLKTTLEENLKDIFGQGFGKKLLAWTERATSRETKLRNTKSSGQAEGLSINEIYKEWLSSESTGHTPFANYETGQDYLTTKGYDVAASPNEDRIAKDIEREIVDELRNDENSKEEWLSLPDRIELTPTARETIDELQGSTKGFFTVLILAKLVASISIKVIERFRLDQDHGFHATIVEEVLREVFVSDIGQWAWSEMKGKAQAMWQEEGCVGHDLVKELNERVPGISINIVGHSAGSICAAKLIELIATERSEIKISKVALWAPACSSMMFKKTFVNNNHLVGDFRMYTMADKFERNDRLVDGFPWIYPSSLLYFISGVLEQFSDFPIAGMERFLTNEIATRSQELQEIRSYLLQNERVVLSETSAEAKLGFRSTSLDHGYFNQDTETLKSLAHFFYSPDKETQEP